VTPLTCQVTAVLGEPFTDALNCCVAKSGTVAAVGDTVTVVGAPEVTTGVECDEPPHPHNKTGTQLRARNDAQRMKFLAGGQDAHFKSRNQEADSTKIIDP
jgi:hypothetical protein